MPMTIPSHPLFKDLTGSRFGRLKVIRYAGRRGSQRKTLWECQCDCGETVEVFATCLQRGTQSCGCWHREVTGTAHRTHGLSKSPEYRAYHGMIRRCTEASEKSFCNYGGRGIRVCDRWLESFENFFADMGRRPGAGYEIDRIDTNGNYEPRNCRWVTRKQNARNKRSNRLIQFNGESFCSSQWAERTGLPRHVIEKRINVGWSVADALTRPLRHAKASVCGPDEQPRVEIEVHTPPVFQPAETQKFLLPSLHPQEPSHGNL